MKIGKPAGTSGITAEMLNASGDMGAGMLTNLTNDH